MRRFAGKARARARKSRTDRGNELLPARRPLHQELGRVVQMHHVPFELERTTQA